MKFDKKPLLLKEQLLQLKERGLHFTDEEDAELLLSNISYYRLSAYWYPFLKDKSNHVFKDKSSFDAVIQLYEFDQKLRTLLFDAIEVIEVSLRTQIIYHLSHHHGAWWFEDASLFNNAYQFSNILGSIEDEIKRSNEVFIRHYQNKYTSPSHPPAWMTIEITTLGQLSKIYRNLKSSDAKKEIAQHFNLHPRVLESWMQSFSLLRNLCAHHSRLWNRIYAQGPTLMNKAQNKWIGNTNVVDSKRMYALICAVEYALNQIQSRVTLKESLPNLLAAYPIIDTKAMGFTPNWQQEPLWKV